jgi:hypothetical protein
MTAKTNNVKNKRRQILNIPSNYQELKVEKGEPILDNSS